MARGHQSSGETEFGARAGSKKRRIEGDGASGPSGRGGGAAGRGGAGRGRGGGAQRGRGGARGHHQPHKQQPRQQQAAAEAQPEPEPDVNDDDIKFFGKNAAYASFLAGLDVNKAAQEGKKKPGNVAAVQAKKKPSRQSDSDSDADSDGSAEDRLQAIEQRHRTSTTFQPEQPNRKERSVGLPVKTADGKLRVVKEKVILPDHDAIAAAQDAKDADEDDQQRGGEDADEQQSDADMDDGVDSSSGGSEAEDGDADEETKATPAQQAAQLQADEDMTPEEAAEAVRDADLIAAELREYESLTPAQRVERRKRKMTDMALIADTILACPERNVSGAPYVYDASRLEISGPDDVPKKKMNSLVALHRMALDPDSRVASYALLSQVAVIQDIAPGYRIRLPTAAEMAVKVKKEVKELREFERGILTGYQRLLKHLESTARALDQRDLADGPEKRAALLALKCMCKLLVGLPHFNFRPNLVAALVPRLRNKDADVVKIVCDAFESVFKNDVPGNATLEIVRNIGALVKKSMQELTPAPLLILGSIPLTTSLDDVKGASQKRKRTKDEVAQGLEVADAEDVESRKRNQVDILKAVMVVYFRVLRGGYAPLLPSVLKGLAKFTHLLDIDVVIDLVELFRDLLDSPNLSFNAAIGSLLCVLKVLQGPGKPLDMDAEVFVNHLYRVLPGLAAAQHVDSMQTAMHCLDAALIARHEIDTARVAAFLKRLLVIAVHLPVPQCFACMSFARVLMQRYPQSQALLDSEHDRAASGAVDLETHAIDASNCIATAAWEIPLLQRHFHPGITTFVQGVAHAQAVLPMESATTLLRTYDTSKGGFNPPVQIPNPKRRARVSAPASPFVLAVDKFDHQETEEQCRASVDFSSHYKTFRKWQMQVELVRLKTLLAAAAKAGFTVPQQ